MLKKLLFVLLVCLCFIPIVIADDLDINSESTSITKRVSNPKYDMVLYPGDRIIVIRAGATVYTKITPVESRLYDAKVPEGKVWIGTLEEKIK